jgi:ribonucleoside-triphosphate reductase
MKNECKSCGSENIYGMSRVVGYYSIIENWNGSKQAELVDRKKGIYAVPEAEVLSETTQKSCDSIKESSEQEVIMVH